MKRDLRIVFMGTPEFAVSTLDAILSNGFNVVGVITAPDKPAGRGRQLNQSAVKTFALSKGLTVLQPTNLKNENFIAQLQALKANLQVVVAFRMLPKVVWQMPEYGTFNLHASLLPNYRGAAPINWAIINGETKTGVSTFFIDEKIDTGEMILQKEVEIPETETAGELHDKLMHIGSQLVVDTLNLVQKGNVVTIPQKDNHDIKTAYKLDKDNCFIDWNRSVKDIYNQVRGLNPYPAAWCLLKNGDEELNIKVYSVEAIECNHDYSIGMLITNKQDIKVAAKNGMILLNEIKLPGKRKMDVKSLLNGFEFHAEAKML
ncbi:MAG: methionyl-tRNA formyltransferase [Flavobacteriaceae bacterium]|nr:methionyl-tRNA formyltransferase [Flavobacteriaceae bacterium]